MNATIVLKQGRGRIIADGHPWVFAEAIEKAEELPYGTIVNVLSSKNKFLGQAFYNSHSSISLRMLTHLKEQINEDWFRKRIRASIKRRDAWKAVDHEIQRLVAFEGDGVPGLIVDRYADYLIFQILSAGMENFRSTVIESLKELNPKGIIERSDEKVRQKEGLEERKELVYGELPPKDWSAKEYGLNYFVDLWNGHKTGFYIDQSRNRKKLQNLMSKGGEVLNCFCYTGGFSLSVLKAGASKVTSVDASLPALENLEKNFKLNGFDPDQHVQIQGDVFDVLNTFKGEKTFEGVILDPPKFASRKQHLPNAQKAYRELNALGMELVEKGGWLATFTCSGRMTRELFENCVKEAAVKVGQVYVVEDVLSQSEDHSVRIGFPESLYLKGLLLRRIE